MNAFQRAWEALFNSPRGDVKTAVKENKELIKKINEKPKAKRVIKIALDQSIGREKAKRLRKFGYEIVVIAQDSEPDDVWLAKAFDLGALFVVSPDLDIPNLIERENYYMVWIDYLHGQKGLQAEYIHKRIQEKMKFLGESFGDKT